MLIIDNLYLIFNHYRNYNKYLLFLEIVSKMFVHFVSFNILCETFGLI